MYLGKGHCVWAIVPIEFSRDGAMKKFCIGEAIAKQKNNKKYLRSALEKTLFLETGVMFSQEKIEKIIELLELDFSEGFFETAHYEGEYEVVDIGVDWQAAMVACQDGFYPSRISLRKLDNPEIQVEIHENRPYESAG